MSSKETNLEYTQFSWKGNLESRKTLKQFKTVLHFGVKHCLIL